MTRAEILHDHHEALPKDVSRLIDAELQSPVVLETDTSLRFKVTDSCGMACTFCHNEGTPVENATQKGSHGRVSIYENTNGVNFTPGAAELNARFEEAIRAMRDHLSLNDLHWTGGEPTHNKAIPQLTARAIQEGYVVKMTSNGETGDLYMQDLAAAGLQSINFSIFGTTAEEIAEIQSDRFKNTKYGAQKLAKLGQAIDGSIRHGIIPKANIVVPDESSIQRVHRVIHRFGDKVKIRLLPSLDAGDQSPIAIYSLLASLHATPSKRYIAAGSSNTLTMFDLPDGQQIGYKQISRVTLPESCNTCDLNNPDDCNEGYYGVRMYIDSDGEYKVGICIQRMDLTVSLNEFCTSTLPDEIKAFRTDEMTRLQKKYQPFLVRQTR